MSEIKTSKPIRRKLAPGLYLGATVLIVALIIIYSIISFHHSQRNMSAVMTEGGARLLESIAFNSKTIIEGKLLLEDAVRNGYIRSIYNLQTARNGGYLDSDYLQDQVLSAEADGGCVIHNHKITVVFPDKSTPLGRYIQNSVDTLSAISNDLMEGEFETFPMPKYNNTDIIGVGGIDSEGYSYFIFKIGTLELPGWQEMTIKNLIDNISKEPGIEYILLQNYDGIVFASKKIKRMIRIKDDPFLEKVLENSTTSSRFIDFNGRTVLEVVKPFYSHGEFSGVFRLGLSLNLYNKLILNYKTRIILLTTILIALIIIISLVLLLRQKYQTISENYEYIHNLFKEILSQIPGGVIEVDNEGRIIALNEAGAEILGVEAKSAIGKRYTDIVSEDIFRFEQTADDYRLALEIEFDRSDGNRRIITIVSTKIKLPADGGYSNLSIFNDITELRKFEEEARRDRRLKELGDMSAGVAHEIKNPLNAIAIAVQRLKEELPGDSDAEIYSLLEYLYSETKRLNRIVNEFLLFARYIYKPGTSNLQKEIINAVELLKPQAEENKIEISIEVDSKLEVMLSPDDLQKVMINIIANSISACKKGGKIKIDATKISDDKAEISIADDGEGIPNDIIDKIFEPYISGRKGGTGLGMAITAKIIHNAGGNIRAENLPKGGAKFRIILPVRKDEDVPV